MSRIKTFIRQHPLLSYLALTFALSWGSWLLLTGGAPLRSDPRFMSIVLAAPVAPAIAGLLLTGLTGGVSGYRELLARLLRWRVETRWYVVALLPAPLVTIMTSLLLALSLRSPEFIPAIFTTADPVGLLLPGVIGGLLVGLCEEIGWTGFAIPRLRLRYGVLATGLLLGMVWGAWHAPLFSRSDSFAGALPLALLLLQLFSWMPAYRALMVWVYDRTGSLLVAVLMHVSLSATAIIIPPPVTSDRLSLTSILVSAATWWLLVAAVQGLQTLQRPVRGVMENDMRPIRKIFIPLAAILLLVVFWIAYRNNTRQEKISEFGKYQGYAAEMYDGSKRTSDYLTLSDGTRLAYDLFLPTKKNVLANQALPVLFKYTPYGRAWTVFDKAGNVVPCELFTVWYCEPMARARAWLMPRGRGRIMDALSRTEWLGAVLKSGYAVIVVDRPGTGASFGQFNGDPEVAAHETDEILNWIAAQEWSDGNIGMFGDSIQAQIQFRAASTGNPHLKAILPATTWMDNYGAVMFPGGVPDQAMADFYARANKAFDAMATPVDQDKDGTLLAQARAERHNTSALAEGVETFESIPFRDSGQNFWITYQTLYPLLERINQSNTAVYLINGWYDIYARDNFLIYNNLTVPKRLLVRPVDHAGIESPGSDVDYGAEAHRWFDYWLKGIDNGIMDEPPIHYYLQGVEKTQTWQSTDTWPLQNQVMTPYYFGSGEEDAQVSVNDGGLSILSPAPSQAFDAYTVDYATTTGKTPLWTGLAMPHVYPNMRSNDARALTYTTPPLQTAITVAGHPIIHIWLSSDAPDLDTFVYLEEVDHNGNSTYITEGELRASHRQLNQAPFDSYGLPWRNHFQSELQPIPSGEPFELVFDLRPTAWQFSPGKQIRIAVAFADSGNFDTPVLDPAPTLHLLRDAGYPSYVELPILQKYEFWMK